MSNQPIDQLASVVPRGVAQLSYAIKVLPGRLARIPESQTAAKPGPDKWSAKQELGHLIDSAVNNHQRLVRAQLEDDLALSGYDGERWVEIHNYQERVWSDLIGLWQS